MDSPEDYGFARVGDNKWERDGVTLVRLSRFGWVARQTFDLCVVGPTIELALQNLDDAVGDDGAVGDEEDQQ